MTEVDKLIAALRTGAKSRDELESFIGFKSEVKNIVHVARKKGFSIVYQLGAYSLEKY